MPIEKITTKIIVEVDNRNGRHKVTRHGVVRDSDSPLQDTPFTEPVKRMDIEQVLGGEVGLNAETISALSSELDLCHQTSIEQLDKISELNGLLDQKKVEIDQLQSKLASVGKVGSISATALRLALLKVGFGPEEIEVELKKLDKDDPEMAKEVRIIWEYNTHYDRKSALVELMGARAGLTSDQLDQLFGINGQ